MTNDDRNDADSTVSPTTTTGFVKPKKLTGFAAMTPERQREIARMGQAALKTSGKRYQYTPEKAREAARIGWARRRGTGG